MIALWIGLVSTFLTSVAAAVMALLAGIGLV